MLPGWSNRLLPEGQSAQSINSYVFTGELQGWRTPKLLRTLTNSAAKFAYRLPNVAETVAGAYLLFLMNPSPGDTFTLGEDTYTFSSTITAASPAYQIKIGATFAITAANTFAALTFDNALGTNAGVLYSLNTIANGAIAKLNEVAGYNNGIGGALGGTFVSVIAPDFGAAYNNTNVSESTGGVRTIWLSDVLSLTHTTLFFTGGTNANFNNLITGPSTWLEFLDPDTNVLKSQVVNDQFQRFYFASPSEPPQYNTTNRILAGKPPFLLGINPPGCAPEVTVTGGGNSATLGPQTSLGGTVSVGANTIYLLPIVPNAAMNIIDVQFMPAATDPAVNFVGVVYEDLHTGGNTPTAPGALLATGSVLTGIVSGTLSASQFVNPIGLNAESVYWVGIMMDTTELIANGDGFNGSVAFPNTFANGPPGFAPAVTAGEADLQMYADLQTADVIEARAYVYTWVSAYGEESPPSPFTLVNGWANGVWTIGLWLPPPDDLGINRNLAYLRLYRTVTASAGPTAYFWVADVSLGSTEQDAINAVLANTQCLAPSLTYVDVSPDSTVALNLTMPSVAFYPPPEGMLGFINMPNGMVCGFKTNELWFCQPYFPHAWSAANTLTTDFPIVGIGLTSGSVVACTAANSYIATGVNPSAMSLIKTSHPDPCTARGSILPGDLGVTYISPNGLIQVTNGGVSTNLTAPWITRERWAQLVPLKNTRAIHLASCYFCFGATVGTGATEDVSVAQQGFNIELLGTDSTSFTIWPQPGGHRVGFNLMNAPGAVNIDNVLTDPWTSYGMLIQGGNLYWYDFTDSAPVMQTYDWSSKIFQQNNKKSWEAFKVWFTVPPGTPPISGCRNEAPASDPSWLTLAPGVYANVLIYMDTDDCDHDGLMNLVTAREVRKSGELLRILDGFKAEAIQVRVIGRVPISNIQIATSAKELANV